MANDLGVIPNDIDSSGLAERMADELLNFTCHQWRQASIGDTASAATEGGNAIPSLQQALNEALETKAGLQPQKDTAEGEDNTEDQDASIAESPLFDPIQDKLGGFFVGQREGLRRGAFLIEDIIPAHGLGFVYGPPGCNKTTLMIDIAVHMAAGRSEWNGRQIIPGPVLFHGMEDVHGAFRLARGLSDRHGFDLAERQLYIPDTPLDLKTDPGFAQLVQGIERLASLNKAWPRLVVIDTLSDALSDADDSDQKEVKQLLQRAENVSKQLGVFICFIHHETKNSGVLRGSGTLKAKAYAVLKIEKSGNSKQRKVIVEKLRGGADGETFGLQLQPHNWVDPEEGELSCAAVDVTFDAEVVSLLSPQDRYTRSCQRLGVHQKAIALSTYQLASAATVYETSEVDNEGLCFRAFNFEDVFNAYSNYCQQQGMPVPGNSDSSQRSEFCKKLKALAEKPEAYISRAGDRPNMVIWIPRLEFVVPTDSDENVGRTDDE